MTIGTGFFGRSSLTENLQPRDLVQWTQLGYASDPSEPFGDFAGLEPWSATPPAPPAGAGGRATARSSLVPARRSPVRRSAV